MKYEVTLEFTHDFTIDLKGLCVWAETTLSLTMDSSSDSWAIFSKEGELAEDITGEYSSDEKKQLIEYYNLLEEATEEISLAAPSRLTGQELIDWKETKKGEIALITDFATLTEAQKKLWMGLPLTDAEMDGLGV